MTTKQVEEVWVKEEKKEQGKKKKKKKKSEVEESSSLWSVNVVRASYC